MGAVAECQLVPASCVAPSSSQGQAVAMQGAPPPRHLLHLTSRLRRRAGRMQGPDFRGDLRFASSAWSLQQGWEPSWLQPRRTQPLPALRWLWATLITENLRNRLRPGKWLPHGLPLMRCRGGQDGSWGRPQDPHELATAGGVGLRELHLSRPLCCATAE